MPRQMHDQLGGGTPPAHPDAQMAAHMPEPAPARTERPRVGEGGLAAGRPIVVPLSLRARTR